MKTKEDMLKALNNMAGLSLHDTLPSHLVDIDDLERVAVSYGLTSAREHPDFGRDINAAKDFVAGVIFTVYLFGIQDV